MIRELSFEIDKLTNSVEEIITRQKHETIIEEISSEDIKSIHKKDGWHFNWKLEYRGKGRRIYQLKVQGNPKIQGLRSLEPKMEDKYIEMHLLEAAPHNVGKNKQYIGVPGNLVAFACKSSFDLGMDGFVAFTAKTDLVKHYIKTLGAHVIYGKNRMAMLSEEARILVNLYYKNYHYGQEKTIQNPR